MEASFIDLDNLEEHRESGFQELYSTPNLQQVKQPKSRQAPARKQLK